MADGNTPPELTEGMRHYKAAQLGLSGEQGEMTEEELALLNQQGGDAPNAPVLSQPASHQSPSMIGSFLKGAAVLGGVAAAVAYAGPAVGDKLTDLAGQGDWSELAGKVSSGLHSASDAVKETGSAIAAATTDKMGLADKIDGKAAAAISASLVGGAGAALIGKLSSSGSPSTPNLPYGGKTGPALG